MNFNKQQEEIINSVEGAFLISAPVGTGKTTVLTERVVKALESGIKPEEILCLTFTNRAAEEMIERIKVRVQKKEIFEKLMISTFHGFCAYFIRAEAKQIGINSDFVIFDESEQYETMRAVLENFPGLVNEGKNEKRETFDLIEKVYKRRLTKLEQNIGCAVPKIDDDKILDAISKSYIEELNIQNAIDFNELVLFTIESLYKNNKLRDKWASRFKFIQLDEFQDTHLSEYLVIKELAKKYKNISFIGDLDQTIYSWRGSEPYFIAELFKKHFAPVKEFHLQINYRFNRNILEAIKSFLNNFEKRATKNIETTKTEEGDKKCVEVFGGYNQVEEISWVVDEIENIKKEDPDSRIAVLARANFSINRAAEIFTNKGVAHITVDKYDFFRRQEIKDVFAYLKILFNKYDLESAYRIIQRPLRNIGPTTLKKIREEGSTSGLRISDFLDFKNFNFVEPFESLRNKWKSGRIIVFDTETTGTNTLKDEIIQIYAIEIVNGKPGKDFHFHLKNTIPVGNSEMIHGISDEYLKKNGYEPKEVLNNLKNFISGDVMVGHNVNFDLTMTLENGKRHGIKFDFKEYYDTLDLSRRLVESENYKLNTLAKKFNLKTATHDAKDDVLATVGLLEVLVDKLEKGKKQRQEIFSKLSKKFIKLASEIKTWQKGISNLRPHEALKYIWTKTGLKDYYVKTKEANSRQISIETLIDIFEKKDDIDRPGDIVLRELINYATLSRDINFLGLDNGKVPIVTVHQVKGLEFDYVFIIGMNEYKFPIRFQGSNLEEEKRLFYVALTRAKKKIYLSYSRYDDYGRNMAMSSFIHGIDEQYVKMI
ncbi:UvrD-helicase domain-containing protein [Candidatus Parcubacteria bacterium]|nr:UvrD-helicase domain-containing protein [Candidatus Parcubacteria bacterium]